MRNDLCDFNDAYIVVRGKITAANPDPPDDVRYGREIALKTSAPFFNCVLKINNQLIEDVQDLDVVIPMHNLLYCSKNFRKTTGSLWNHYPDIPSSEYVGNNERIRVFYPISGSKIFIYKTRLVGKLPDGENELEDVRIVVPLKSLSNFIFNLDILLINAEIELILKWSQNCVLTEKATREAKDAIVGPPALDTVAAINIRSDLKFNITGCKLYVPVVTLQAEYPNQLYEELKAAISIDFTWSKY